MNKNILMATVLAALGVSQVAQAACSDIVPVLRGAVAASGAANLNADGGYPLNFWVSAVDETGKVCAVVTNGVAGATAGNSEWLGSRVISAQKANTANAFSLDAYAISTANLYSAVQPGGSLFGLQESNPVNAEAAYDGNAARFGQGTLDPMVGKRIGGVNVFGGGLALYKGGKKVGAIGVSGDTSCADHVFAWKVRKNLKMQPSDGQVSGLASASPSGFVGITTVNFTGLGALNGADVAGTANSTPLAGATQGDEMVIAKPTGSAGGYWAGWSQPACPNTLGYGAGVSLPDDGTLFF